MRIKNILVLILAFITIFNSCKEDEEFLPTFIDSRDGKVYKYININDQTWMAENLNYDTGNGSWVYENDESSAEIYGRLYDWETACDVCPNGWHLSTDSEWIELTNYLGTKGHSFTEGIALKATRGWNNGGNGTDNYGFTALPGGNLGNNGTFANIGNYGYWWTSTEDSSTKALSRYISSYHGFIFTYLSDKKAGYSVRCVKD